MPAHARDRCSKNAPVPCVTGPQYRHTGEQTAQKNRDICPVSVILPKPHPNGYIQGRLLTQLLAFRVLQVAEEVAVRLQQQHVATVEGLGIGPEAAGKGVELRIFVKR